MTRNTRQEETIIRLSPPPSPESVPGSECPPGLGIRSDRCCKVTVALSAPFQSQDEIIFSCFFLLVFYCSCLGVC